jgi:hypothetical protein
VIVEDATETLLGPDIVPALGFTVTTAVAIQELEAVKVIVVLPAEMPVTIPPPVMVPTAGVLLDHERPDDTSVRLVIEPTQTVRVPPIAAGAGFTVTAAAL